MQPRDKEITARVQRARGLLGVAASNHGQAASLLLPCDRGEDDLPLPLTRPEPKGGGEREHAAGPGLVCAKAHRWILAEQRSVSVVMISMFSVFEKASSARRTGRRVSG